MLRLGLGGLAGLPPFFCGEGSPSAAAPPFVSSAALVFFTFTADESVFLAALSFSGFYLSLAA